MSPEVVTNLLTALVVALISILTFALKSAVGVAVKYLEVKIGVDQTNLLKAGALNVVRFLNQSGVFKDLENSKKKEIAMVQVAQWAAAHNLPITDEYLDKLVEEAVHIMKSELPVSFDDISGDLVLEPVVN
jgi:hypothetical protein